jgi:hypothetical protein
LLLPGIEPVIIPPAETVEWDDMNLISQAAVNASKVPENTDPTVMVITIFIQ